jgi:DNA-directed RNA polymerase subunit F
MALQAIYKNRDDIPEALRSFYVENEGEWVLEVDDTDYKGTINEFRGNNIELNEKVKTLAEQLSKLEGLDPDKHAEFAAAAAELAEIKEKGLLKKAGINQDELQKLLDARTEQMRGQYDDQVKKLTDQVKKYEELSTGLESELRNDRIQTVISQAINEYGVARKGATPLILDQAAKVWQLDEGRQPVAMRDGQKLFGEKGDNPLTPGEWIKGLARDMPYLFEANAGGGARGGTGSGNGAATGTVDWNDQAAINANVDKIATGEVVVVGGPE